MSTNLTDTTFTSLIESLNAGTFNDELSEELRNVVKGVLTTGKKGSLSLKIEILPDEVGDNWLLFSLKDIKVSVPTMPRRKATLYALPNGNLHHDEPEQEEMFPRGVDTSRGRTA